MVQYPILMSASHSVMMFRKAAFSPMAAPMMVITIHPWAASYRANSLCLQSTWPLSYRPAVRFLRAFRR